MAWKKVVVSGSSPEFNQLTLDTPLSTANGGTGLASGEQTTIGTNLLKIADQAEITFLRMNANETVDALNAAAFRTAIGAGDGSGTVTSVTAGTGMTQTGTDTINPTLNVIGGTGITANADDIAITAGGVTATQLATSVAGDGLAGGGGTALSVNVDDSSIEIDTDSLRVKALGVTNAMLAGSIANAKLANSTISGVALGNNLNDLTVDDSTISLNSGTTFNGSAGRTVGVKAGGIGTTEIADSLGAAGVNQFTGSFSGSFKGNVDIDLADLTDGNGIADFTYDGNSTATIAVEADGTTLSVGSGGVKVADAGITATQLNASVAGSGLAGGAGTALSVGVDDSSVEITGDTLNVKALGVTNAMLAGSIANAKLANSTISGVALGNNLSSLSVDDSSIEYSSGTSFNGSAASTIQVKALGITNAMLAGSITSAKLAGSIANAKLANSTISGVALGNNLNSLSVDDSSIEYSSGTSFNGSAASTIQVKALGVTNAMLAGSIANAKLAQSAITVGGVATSLGSTVTGAHIATALNSDLGGNFTIGNQDDDTAAFSGPVTMAKTLTIAEDLVVQGTASFQSTDNLLVKDKFIMLASGSAGATDGGIVIEQSTSAGGPKGAVFAYDGLSTGRWGISTGFNPTGSGYTPDAFMAAAVIVGGTDPDTVAAAYKVAGNIACTNDGEIYIYKQ